MMGLLWLHCKLRSICTTICKIALKSRIQPLYYLLFCLGEEKKRLLNGVKPGRYTSPLFQLILTNNLRQTMPQD